MTELVGNERNRLLKNTTLELSSYLREMESPIGFTSVKFQYIKSQNNQIRERQRKNVNSSSDVAGYDTGRIINFIIPIANLSWGRAWKMAAESSHITKMPRHRKRCVAWIAFNQVIFGDLLT